MSTTGLEIKERKIVRTEQKKDPKKPENGYYPRYSLNLPREFVEKHKLDKLYLIADEVWFGVPDASKLMKIISVIPQVKELLGDNKLSKEQIETLLIQCPEIREYLVETPLPKEELENKKRGV